MLDEEALLGGHVEATVGGAGPGFGEIMDGHAVDVANRLGEGGVDSGAGQVGVSDQDQGVCDMCGLCSFVPWDVGAGCQLTCTPPSTSSTVPVTHGVVRRKSTAEATSAAVPTRPAGTPAA